MGKREGAKQSAQISAERAQAWDLWWGRGGGGIVTCQQKPREDGRPHHPPPVVRRVLQGSVHQDSRQHPQAQHHLVHLRKSPVLMRCVGWIGFVSQQGSIPRHSITSCTWVNYHFDEMFSARLLLPLHCAAHAASDQHREAPQMTKDWQAY